MRLATGVEKAMSCVSPERLDMLLRTVQPAARLKGFASNFTQCLCATLLDKLGPTANLDFLPEAFKSAAEKEKSKMIRCIFAEYDEEARFIGLDCARVLEYLVAELFDITVTSGPEEADTISERDIYTL